MDSRKLYTFPFKPGAHSTELNPLPDMTQTEDQSKHLHHYFKHQIKLKDEMIKDKSCLINYF